MKATLCCDSTSFLLMQAEDDATGETFGQIPAYLLRSGRSCDGFGEPFQAATDLPSPHAIDHHGGDVLKGTVMVWLVLESLLMPGYRLHSERKWLSMEEGERSGLKIVKRCDSRDEANAVIDALNAASPGPFGKRRPAR
jgi:hypothetical protein